MENENIPCWTIDLPVRRRKSREVMVGKLAIGGDNPVRIQSMTNTDTMDTKATVEQCLRLVDVGCELVRITASNVQAAENLYNIKNELSRRGCDVPLVADIHFNPKAAEVAAAIVEKVRINPGNYTDRNKGKYDYTEQEYADELQRTADRLYPLIQVCKEHSTAMRIGINHGSLSERVMGRYGDTPYAMVMAAMEFINICRQMDYNDLVLSMKSSNVKVMHYATRMLAAVMQQEGLDYPIHLGVTEAGNAREGRIKSMTGIGSLLALGIGDTIRVSLTEAPENEIPVARQIREAYSHIGISGRGDVTLKLKPEFRIRRTPVDIASCRQFSLSEHSPEEILYALKNEPFAARIVQGKNKEISTARLAGDSAALIMESAVETLELNDSELTADILQATGERIYKAEFIACPSCGRTKYDIQSALEQVKKRCSHLKGLKIAVMGCIVNGPGEMADAHYGYIGSREGKVHLYRAKQLVCSNVDEKEAVDRLVEMIKQDGKWQEE